VIEALLAFGWALIRVSATKRQQAASRDPSRGNGVIHSIWTIDEIFVRPEPSPVAHPTRSPGLLAEVVILTDRERAFINDDTNELAGLSLFNKIKRAAVQ
jgi:hypothetical protein